MKTIAPFGSWKSPITPEFVSGKDRVLTSSIQVDGDSIYFIEQRPDEAGRSVLMCLKPGKEVKEVLPQDFNVRTRYLEYSGLSFLVSDNICYFVHFADQEVYIAEPNKPPRKLTHEKGNRFADFSLDKKRNRLVALREVPGHPEAKNSICTIDLETGHVEDLVTGFDFYNSARVNGDKLLWISWCHPNMPWNGTELWVADINCPKTPKKIVGDAAHSVAQARWGENESIYFIAELDKFTNLYSFSNNKIDNLFPRNNEFAIPDWVPGTQQYAILENGSICATYLQQGRWQIVLKDSNGLIQEGSQSFATMSAIHKYNGKYVAVAGQSTKPTSIIFINTNGTIEELYSPKITEISIDFISVAEEIQFPTEDGSTGYAWFCKPKSVNFSGPEGEKPPLIVCAHGGPTSMSPPSFRKDFQFWTSRGYAVLDVNYGGSTGYGRTYRERLRGNWGLVDVSDCVLAVKSLVEKGIVDPRRVAIRGSSAGGYTTLAALAFTKNIFTAGASYYGVSDLELLAKETHKFESRYLDQLVGPYPAAVEIYKKRAPLEHIDQFSCPIIFFQGDEDKVVPPNQSELMHNLLKQKGIPTEYHLYKQEGHGFRRSETIQHALKSEHSFYARFFGFDVQPEDKP